MDSKKDVGTVFTVDIPFELYQNNNHKHRVVTNFSEISALIVDDDKDLCEYTGILMERLGVKYDYVTDGETALEMLGEADDNGNMYDICFVDWKMPDMDGIEVTQAIRENFGKDTIVIIVSAYDLNEVEEEGKRAGADYLISKPLFQSTVFDILMRITDSKYEKVCYNDNNKKKYDFTGKKVLIAEDVELNMEVAVSLLKMVNFEVVCAEDGVKALEMYNRSEINEYDVILLDINMPNVDGYETARAIRASKREDGKTIPIYALTANAFTEDVAAALDAGMNGHIAKPIETDALYATLNSVFEEK